MDKNYKGLIWTNHALNRLRQRGISQSDAWATWLRPDQSRKGTSGNWVYYRNISGSKIEVVAKKNEKGEWVIISVWSKKIINYSKKSNAKSLWQLIKSAIFG